MRGLPRFFTALALCLCWLPAQAVENTLGVDLQIADHYNAPGLKIVKPSAQTSNLVECTVGTNLVFALPAAGVLTPRYGGTGATNAAAAQVALGIQRGTFTTAADGKLTNTFTTAFSAAPVVVLTAKTATTLGNGAQPYVAATTTNFVAWGATNVVYQWIAVQ